MKNGADAKKECWLLQYTVLFACLVVTLGLIMLKYRRLLIWTLDGSKQPYTVLGYMGNAIRGLLAGEGWPMLDFSLGQGMDLLTTCTFYGFTDPFTLLGALVQKGGIEWMYLFTLFLHAYLAGITFAVYARKIGVRDGWALACSAAIYVASGYFLWMLGRHPHFLNGALYLPLLLIGVERILDGRRWLMFTLIAALTLIVNFYFAYMNTIVAIVYIIVRLIARIGDRGVGESAKDGFMLLGAYLLGAALSAVVFLPVVRIFLENSRLGIKAGYRESMLHYAPSFYRALALSVFSPWDGPGNFLALNLAPLAAPGLIALLFMRGGKARQARVALVLCFAAACVPAAGLVINAGAYVTNRWSYALNMFSALGCALGLPVAFEKRGTHSKIIAGLAMGVSLLLAAGILKWGDKKQLVAPGLLFAFAALLLAYQLDLTRQLNQHRLRACASILLAISCALYAAIGYLPRGYGYILQQEPVGLYDAIASRSGAQLIDDDGVYRVSQGKFDDANAPVLGYMGTSFYWSLVNARISAYYQKLNLPTLSTTYHVYGLGANAWMNTAASVKYFMKHDGDDHVVPYGFQEEQQLTMPDGSAAAVYENSHALPLGYAFDATLSEHDYDALPVEARFQALLERAIVDEPGAMAAVPERSIESAAVTVPYEIVGMENVEMDGKSIRAEENGRIRLSFHPEADSEVYVLFKGLKTNSDAKVHDGLITLQTGEGIAEANVLHPRNNFYYAKEDYAFCIGSLAPQGCDIVFECAMDYTYDELRVVALPMAAYRAAAEARRSEAMTDVELGRDSIKGRISIAGDRILQIAVPHSDGWRAWVDGQEQPVLHCGGMYMGIALDAGEHDIEMRYVTPGLIPGAIISAIALLVTLALAIVTRRRRRHGRERA